MYDLIVIGGGAAGIFASIIAKEKQPNLKVLVIEKSKELLAKVRISGGGRCNLTNSTFDIKALAANYPRGQKELLSAFHQFSAEDTINWFEAKNVPLKTEADGRVFPKSDSSETIVNCFLKTANQLGVEILKEAKIKKIEKASSGFTIELENKETFACKKLLLATGSAGFGFQAAKELGHTIIEPIASLFGLNIVSFQLQKLSGLSVSAAAVKIKGFNSCIKGPVLITHFGFSGPAVLNLSACAARYLFDNKYRAELQISWLDSLSQKEILEALLRLKKNFSQQSNNKYKHKKLTSENVFKLPKALWDEFLKIFKIDQKKIVDISQKELLTLTRKLHEDTYLIDGKTTNKKEFVTCGGVCLKEVNFKTMESKICPNLYFAGEILNIDGITGGFNFQNAWTTAYVAASFQ